MLQGQLPEPIAKRLEVAMEIARRCVSFPNVFGETPLDNPSKQRR
jgi:hypothetical protein